MSIQSMICLLSRYYHRHRPIPPLRDNTILVNTISVGLNPTNWKTAFSSSPSVAVGCDYAGIIEAIGPGDYVFDYREPDVPERIREVSRDELTLVLDTISTPETAAVVPRDDVRSRWTLGYTVGGYEFLFHGERVPVIPEDWEFAEEWLETATRLLADGVVGGLEGVIGELQGLREERVRGCKLVFDVDVGESA
ncbi:uncharacterized protein BO96DRAFT_431825 [Aspergillus niger CBS 101883]|uniref:uncharacterized protein n=1 Tax=Aspergillus lacticoffeatus (strain CBS 101883) TaxID=1450533 RepID=UPI000D7F45E7|nr:uncharacterized protein BO96DRAFT_431825 [Aspergillus niger CBS 101883]PYH59686.1 hypothetical protein BO96DRAFT_431825 [Aspergillus niger CBS 101883]